jgi:hypothetical protein
MPQSKMRLARGLLHMENFVKNQMRGLPDPPLDRDVCLLPTVLPPKDDHDETIALSIKEVSVPSARATYIVVLHGISRQLNELSDPV